MSLTRRNILSKSLIRSPLAAWNVPDMPISPSAVLDKNREITDNFIGKISFNVAPQALIGKDDSTIPFFYQVHLGNRDFLPKAPRTRVLVSRNAPRPASICRIIAVSLH